MNIMKRAFLASRGRVTGEVSIEHYDWMDSEEAITTITLSDGYGSVTIDDKEFGKLVTLLDKAVAAYEKKNAQAK